MEPVGIEIRKLFEIIEWMYEATSLNALHQSMIQGVAQMIRGDCYDLVLCQFGNDGSDVFHATPGTYTAAEIEFMLRHAGEHPIVQEILRGASGVVSVSQCRASRNWTRSSLYNEGGYRRLGLRHELAVEIPGIDERSLAAFSVVRGGSDFCERDFEILRLLRPHMARAWVLADRRSRKCSAELLRQLFPVLSLREAEILFWIVEGKQNAEIAAIFERSLNTIQEHVENIVHKLGMENRHQMTVAVLRFCLGKNPAPQWVSRFVER